MGTMSRMLLIAGVAACLTTTAHAGYVVSIVDAETGQSRAELTSGERFSLNIVLADNGDGTGASHDAADFVVNFSFPGLILDSYAWAEPPYETSGRHDFSQPANSELPMIIDSIRFSANTELYGTTFETGTLLTMDLTTQHGYGLGRLDVTIADGAAFNDFVNSVFPSVEARSFLLIYGVPEPATLVLLSIGGIAVLRRRRCE